MEKILIVDDEEEIRNLIKDFLIKNNFETYLASNGKEALEKLLVKNSNFDLVILDIMMPEVDGIEVIKALRKISNIPVIFLTSKSEEIDKVLGLEIGADDYITKPFNPREMVARIKAVLRRSAQQSRDNLNLLNKVDELLSAKTNLITDNHHTEALNTNESYKFANEATYSKPIKIFFNATAALGRKKLLSLEINPQSYRVFINGREAKFTHKQYQLLLYLIQNKNIVLSREKILEAVWGFDFSGETRTVDVHIKELRKRIGDANGELIETIWATGYRFNYDKDIN
ncbi:MAG: response regulator transcription factor [Actinobacteria bacterium]|nr:response regulator transcription factor [Cyanobacteriota bacterium]MCL5772662.1 response regulator transcription factor [Actinomycetota bacterium]